MRQKKLLSRALSVLLSGAMIAGSIPAAAFAEEDEAPVYEEVAAAAGFHTLDGYVSEWSYSFEKGFNGTQWKSEDNDEDTYGWDVIETTALAHCGGKFMRSQSQTDSDEQLDPDNWLYSPLIELSEDKEYQLTFNASGMNNTFGVYIAVGRYNYDNYVQLGSDYTISGTGWKQYTIDLSEYAGKCFRLAFVHHNSSSVLDLYLDCMDISGKPKGYTMTKSWGFEDVEFDGESIVADVPKSFIAADKDEDGDTWEVIKADWYAHSGECSVRARGSADVRDNWLRLPQLWLDNDKDYLLTFYVTDSHAGQSVDVYLYGDKCCDCNVTPEDLDGDDIPEYYSKVLTEEIAVVGKVSGWHEVKVDLSDYAGQYVYAAIVQQGGEGEMRVDDIALWQRDAHTPDGDRTNKYFEGFENEDGELPDGWGNFDEDGDGNNWKAYYGGTYKKHHGKGGVYSSSYFYDKAHTPDNWLVMPSRTISTTKITTLTFEAVGSHYEDYNEVFGVFISVDGGEFQQIGKDYTASYVWQEVEVDLTPYAGKSVRVAVVHHNCTAQERLLLDCFNIWEEPLPPIETVDVTVDRPMVGEPVPTTDAEAIKINTDSYDISARAYTFQWTKTSKESYETEETPKYTSVTNGETFSVDYVYRLMARFTLDECYTFADKLKMTVNGIAKYYDEEYEIKGDGNILDVSIIFYPLEAYITDVAVTVTEPVVGAVPDYAPTVVTTPDKTFEHIAAWAKALKEDYTTLTETDWKQITDPTEKFAEGYVYVFAFLMGTDALPQYEISPETTASINGKPALSPTENYCFSPSELYAYAVYDLSSTKPQNVKATPGDGKVDLTWDAVSGATNYTVWVKDGSSWKSLGATGTKTTYTATGLTNGTAYTFAVRAYANSKWSDMSDAVSATPKAAATPAPTNVKAVPGDSKVTLTWDAVSGATNYAVFLRKGTEWLKIGASGTSTTFTSRGLTNGGKYFYMVKAYANGLWSEESAIVSAIPVCTTPQNVKASAGDGKVTLTWDAVSGATNYAVFLRKGTTWLKIGASGTNTTFTARGLANGGKYFFMVKSYVNGVWSDESAIVSAIPVCITPQNVKAVGGAGQATITWDAVSGASNYVVMTKKGTSWVTLGAAGTKTTYTAKDLTGGETYYFVVKAYVNGAWSDMSETVSASVS